MDDRMTPSGGDGPATKRPRTQGQEGHDNRVTDIESNTEHQQDEAQQHERNGDQTGQEAEPGPQLGKDLDNMTETVKAGVFMIQSRTQAADAKVSKSSVKHACFHRGKDIAPSAYCYQDWPCSSQSCS